MEKKKTKLIIRGNVFIAGLIFFTVLFLSAITLIILGIYLDFIFSLLGYIFLSCVLILVVAILIVYSYYPLYIELSNKCFTYKTLYGKIKSQHNLSELKSVELRTLFVQGRGPSKEDYFVFNFSSEFNDNDYLRLMRAKDIMILDYTKRKECLIRQYTDFPIIDARTKRNKIYH